MIPLARRFGGAALTLLAVAVLAVTLHGAFAAHFDPCADPAQLRNLEAYGLRYTVEEREAVAEMPPQRWIDGRLPPAVPGAGRLWFRVARAEEPFALVSQAFLMVPHLPRDRTELRELRVGPDLLPVFRIFDDSLGDIRLTRYFFVHGVTPVSHPFASGIELAWRQLVQGTLPVFAFAVTGAATGETLPALESAEEAWLSAVWSEFRRVCQP